MRLQFGLACCNSNLCIAARERRREEKNAKFLITAEKQLEKELAKPTNAFTAMVKDVEKVYNDFLVEYAACEDRIRGLWKQLLEEHEKLAKVERAMHEKHVKAVEHHGKQAVEAFSKMRTAHEETTRLMENISATVE
ncbi:hypothetical protein AX15_006481 [Amanita polypyramis BW_CC]|nr:hypothetical protein AX15_006481 [Amanita polypyramis BW_CC]